MKYFQWVKLKQILQGKTIAFYIEEVTIEKWIRQSLQRKGSRACHLDGNTSVRLVYQNEIKVVGIVHWP